MEFDKIREGWFNLILPPKVLKEQIEETAAYRLSICNGCPLNSKNVKGGKYYLMDTCTACGCPLAAKTRCLSCNCGIEELNKKNPSNPQPLKWVALVTPEERKAVEERIKMDKDGKD